MLNVIQRMQACCVHPRPHAVLDRHGGSAATNALIHPGVESASNIDDPNHGLHRLWDAYFKPPG